MRLIDADAFKRYLDDGDECINCQKKEMFCSYHCELDNVESNQFERIIDEQPTIDAVEVVHGTWTVDRIDEYELSYGSTGYEPVYRCSRCGHVTESYLRLDRPIMPEDADFPNYCPNCGAKMIGDEDEQKN